MQDRRPMRAAVIGGGPAGLMAAEALAAAGASVTVYDRMPSLGRKLLLAGRGGLNLTHSEPFEAVMTRYGGASEHLRAALTAFPPAELRAWVEGLGQETFVGTSGRVFPKAMKASPLLRAWLARLAQAGVELRTRQTWRGWTPDGRIAFETTAGPIAAEAEVTILALGGASWPRMGSDGRWVSVLRDVGVEIADLRPANCGFIAGWSDVFRSRFEGQPLKRIAIGFGEARARGEAVITRHGIEGGAIYAISAPVREAIIETGEANLLVDLKPDMSVDDLASRLSRPRAKQSLSTFLRKAADLTAPAIGLMQEAAARLGFAPGALEPVALAALIKAVPVRVVAMAPIEGAISTAGGVLFDAVDARLMLRARPGVFVAGEMLDWEAPTGGYLLQASFATGRAAARGAVSWWAEQGESNSLTTAARQP